MQCKGSKRFTWECRVCGTSGNSNSVDRMLFSHMIISEHCPAADPDRTRLDTTGENSIVIDVRPEGTNNVIPFRAI